MATIIDAGPLAPAPMPQVSVPKRKREITVPLWPAAIVIFASILPGEVRFELGSLQFYVYRIGLLIVFPWVLYKTFQGAIRLVLPDYLISISALWIYISLSVNYGMQQGLERGGAQTFDFLAAYFLARISLRSPQAIVQLLRVFAPVFLITGLAVMAESISHVLFVRPFFASIFGKLPTFDGSAGIDLQYETRLGLLRGYGVFPHPILGGLYLTSLLPLYVLMNVGGRARAMGIVAGLCSIFTLSSAAFAGLAIYGALFSFELIQRAVRNITWRGLTVVMVFVLIGLQLVTNGGVISLIIRYIALDPESAYFRTLIWQYGGASALDHPWFGIGFNGYDRPVWMYTPSVDAQWLSVALRFGFPAVVPLGLAVIMIITALSNLSGRMGTNEKYFYRGLALTLVVMSIQMFTVALWGSTLMWFNLLLGMGVSTTQEQLAKYRIKLTW